MFGRKKKKHNSATDVDVNGTPEENTKKKKGLGSSPGISKLFGSLSDGLNKAGLGKEKKSFGGSLREGLNRAGKDNDDTGGQKISFLKSSKKKKAPPPPGKTTPHIFVSVDTDRQARLEAAASSPIRNSSRAETPSTQANGYPFGHDSRLSNNSYHDGGSPGKNVSHNIPNHGSMYASSIASGNSTGSSGLDIRIEDDEDDFVGITTPSSHLGRDGPEYARRPVESWEEEDVLEWLADIGLDYFVDMFQDCGIDGEYILSVTDEDLVELEVDDSQLRHALLTAISDAQKGVVLPPQATITNTPQINTEIYNDVTNHKNEEEDEEEDLIISKKSLDSWSDSEFEFSDPELPDDGVLPRAASPTKPIPAPRSPKREPLTSTSLDEEEDNSELSSYNVDSSEKSYNVDDDDSDDITTSVDIDRRDIELSRIEEEDFEDIFDGDDVGAGDTSVADWEEGQVLTWLTSIGLEHLGTQFKGHNITGNELLNIDMQLLDEMQVSSKDDREKLLSQLYELNNPAANIPQNDDISAINQSSGYERTKFMAAVTVLQSKNTDGIQLLPPDKIPMGSLVENPASPSGSRETSPRTQVDNRHDSPRSHQGNKLSPRSQEGSTYNSPREHEGSGSPTPPERRRYKTPTPPERRKYSSPRSEEGDKPVVSPRSKVDHNLSPITIEGSKQGVTTALENSNRSINSSPTREIRLKNTPSSGSEGSRKSDSEEKKSKGPFGLRKLVGSISPNAKMKPQRGDTAVLVWTKIGTKGPSYSLSFHLTPTSTTADLIKLSLDKLELMDDYRLYSIYELSPSKTKGKYDDRDLEYDEMPLDVRYMWPDHTSCRFELRPRPAQGGSVKVVFHLAGHKPKGKMLSISLSTPACEVVELGLRKFGMINTNPSLYCLLEVDKTGDLHDVDDDALPLQLDSHAFVLCDRAHKETAALNSDPEDSTTNSEGVKRNDSQNSRLHSGSEDNVTNSAGVRRNDSQTSKASSRVSFSGASLASSQGSSSDLLSSQIDDEKLSKLEEEMANIAEALSPRQKSVDMPDSSATTVISPEQQASKSGANERTDHKTTHVQDEAAEDQNNTITGLRQHNEKLEKKTKQLKLVQAALARLEESYRSEIAESHKRVMIPCESDNLPSSVKDLQRNLDEANQQIISKQKCITTLKQQIKKDDDPQDSLDSSIQAAELDYKVAVEETALVALQQDQSRLFTKLELALADHQVAIEKGKSRKYRRPLYPVLTTSMHSNTVILPLHIDLALESHDQNLLLAASKDQRGVVVERCRPQSDLKVGDKLIEVNGENVTRADIVEVNTCLNKSFKAQIVVLREQPIIEDNTAELAKMKQQLSLANQQLESSRRESNRLKEEVRRLRPLESHVIDTTQMKASMQQLQNELSTAQNRSEQLALELVTVRDKSYKQNQMEKKKMDEEMEELKETLTRYQGSMEAKDSKLASVIQDRDAALEKLREMETNDSTKPSALIMDNDEDLPLWESLKSAQKSEILLVLQEEVQEAGRQKNYLDQLYTLMLEKAPELLNDLEEECEISDFSGNEEFC